MRRTSRWTTCWLLLVVVGLFVGPWARAAAPTATQVEDLLGVELGASTADGHRWRVDARTSSTTTVVLETPEGEDWAWFWFDELAREALARPAGGWWLTVSVPPRPSPEPEGEARDLAAFGHVTRAMARLPDARSATAPPVRAWWRDARTSFGAWGVLFAVWFGIVAAGHRTGRRPVELASRLQLNHVTPAVLQAALYLYWASWFPGVVERFTFVLAQLAFAYALDAALSLSIRRRWDLTFGLVPITFATNLFVWFRPPGPGDVGSPALWCLGLAVASRYLIRWKGRHLFNPAAFGIAFLALADLAARFSGIDDLGSGAPTTGLDLNVPPNMTTMILLVGLVAQTRFPIVLVSLGGLLGLEMFTELNSPASTWPATFLVLVLFATDPKTSPRTNPGRLLFGLTLSLVVTLFAEGYRQAGLGEDLAKVLAVTVCNLAVPWFDLLGGWFDRGWRSVAAWGAPGAIALASGAMLAMYEVLPLYGVPLVAAVIVVFTVVPRSWRVDLADLWDPVANRGHVVAWVVLVLAVHSQIKPAMFESFLHVVRGTPGIQVDARGVARCEDNPAWCRPAALGAEARIWLGDTSPRVATAR